MCSVNPPQKTYRVFYNDSWSVNLRKEGYHSIGSKLTNSSIALLLDVCSIKGRVHLGFVFDQKIKR